MRRLPRSYSLSVLGSATSHGSGPHRRPTQQSHLSISDSCTAGSFSPETDSSTARYRKTLLGLGERLSALASGLGDLQPSRSESPDSTSDSRNEAFTTASPVLKSSSALQSKSFATPKIDRQSLKPDSGISPGPRLHL